MAKYKKGQSAYDAALDYLTPKDRTQREVEAHLDDCNYSEIEIINTIDALKANGLINDVRYAANFIESRLNTKPVSRQKLRQQLEGHFIGEDVINDVLMRVDDDTERVNAMAVAEKYYRQFSSLDSKERIRRVGLRLSSRGYSYDCIKIILDDLREREKND